MQLRQLRELPIFVPSYTPYIEHSLTRFSRYVSLLMGFPKVVSRVLKYGPILMIETWQEILILLHLRIFFKVTHCCYFLLVNAIVMKARVFIPLT